MGMAVGGSGGPKSEINMTPMIDVLLVLIIIFMVITPLTPKGLEALVPQPPPPNQKPNQSDQRTVVIVVEKEGDRQSCHSAQAGRSTRPGSASPSTEEPRVRSASLYPQVSSPGPMM